MNKSSKNSILSFSKFYVVFALCCCIFLQAPPLNAQNEANTWYFGEKAGINFTSGKPIALKDGKLSTVEGCASISDGNGNLLFYTDGIKVWDKKHVILKNGEGLKGDASATQSAVIVRKPRSKNIFYIFTVGVVESFGVHYSVVDMSKNGGLGEITEKNVLLLQSSAEKINAVKHKNNQDIWLTTHAWNSDAYQSYLLTKDGITKEPVVSKIGTRLGDNSDNSIGVLKSSPDGKKIVSCIKGLGLFELMDFDNTNGVLSNAKIFQLTKGCLVYGAEFSSDNTKLYISAGGEYKIYQYDLSKGKTYQDIENTKKEIAKNGYWTGALQLAPDGKIYASLYNAKHLGIINNPNIEGLGCNYTEEGLFLEGATGQLGLPTFVQTYFDDSENLKKIAGDRPVQMGQVFTKPILFETDRYNIRPQYFKDLDDLVAYMIISKSVSVEISGHTDSEGTDEKNLLLSQNRAKAVAQYLTSKGINPSRVKYNGFGETTPVGDNNTPQGKALNRRIEFILNK